MKLPNKIKIISGVLLTSLCCLTASCDFLEIVPVEQHNDVSNTPLIIFILLGSFIFLIY